MGHTRTVRAAVAAAVTGSVVALVALVGAGPSTAAEQVVLTQHTAGITGQTDSAVLGPDGNLWFTEFVAGRIGRLAPDGTVTEFTVGLPSDAHPDGIVAGPDGNLWFTISASTVDPIGPCNPTGHDSIGRITPAGTITTFPTPTAQAKPSGITVGPDGALWFAESGYICGVSTIGGNGVGRITTSGAITEHTTGFSSSAGPSSIALGPDGRLWLTELYNMAIAAVTPSGTVTEYPLPSTQFGADIAAGPDGNLWFTMGRSVAAIGRMTPSGQVTTFTAGLSPQSVPEGIAAGPDGALWVADSGPAVLYRVTTDGAVTPTKVDLPGTDLWRVAPGAGDTLWVTGGAGEGGMLLEVALVPTPPSTTTTSAAPPTTAATPVGPVRPAFTG